MEGEWWSNFPKASVTSRIWELRRAGAASSRESGAIFRGQWLGRAELGFIDGVKSTGGEDTATSSKGLILRAHVHELEKGCGADQGFQGCNVEVTHCGCGSRIKSLDI